MAEPLGRPKTLNRRHTIQLSPDLSDQLDEALRIANLKVLLEPVGATLGNPTAFPILIGVVGVVGGALLLRSLFVDPLAAVDSEVRKAADDIARVFWEITHGIGQTEVPGTSGETVENVFDTFTRNFAEAIRRVWEGITKLPPVL